MHNFFGVFFLSFLVFRCFRNSTIDTDGGGEGKKTRIFWAGTGPNLIIAQLLQLHVHTVKRQSTIVYLVRRDHFHLISCCDDWNAVMSLEEHKLPPLALT